MTKQIELLKEKIRLLEELNKYMDNQYLRRFSEDAHVNKLKQQIATLTAKIKEIAEQMIREESTNNIEIDSLTRQLDEATMMISKYLCDSEIESKRCIGSDCGVYEKMKRK